MTQLARCAAASKFYHHAIQLLTEHQVPFLVGGGYALLGHTGISRMTKDFDVFIKPEHVEQVLHVFSAAGCETEIAFSHWLAKAHCGDEFVDFIYNSGNGCCAVDDRWFEHGIASEVYGLPVQLCPPEESIWQKAFIMERERFDGADIVHLIQACGAGMDWHRLLERFGPHWQVLFAHLVLFGFIYPGETDCIPAWVMTELTGRLQELRAYPAEDRRLCRGTLISREQYLTDIRERNYIDARLLPEGSLTARQIDEWTPPCAA